MKEGRREPDTEFGKGRFLRIVRRSLALVWLIVSVGLPAGRAEAGGPVDWAEINPTMADSEYVGDVKVCAKCHEDYIQAFGKTTHSKRFTTHPENKLQERYCEACHGPQSKHAQRPRVPEFRLSLKADGPLTQKQRDSVCLQCHEKGDRMHWQGSTHEMAAVGCANCHYLSEQRSPKALLAFKDPKMVCTQCHKDKGAQLMKSSHHPLREGKMTCTSCHNPHGGPGPSLLKTPTVNETCYLCHAEKRGPMVWEHPPVRERCTNCHEPHGTNFPSLLKMRPPQLCLSCHSEVFHAGQLYDGNNLPGVIVPPATAPNPSQRLLGKGCINCHSNIHGSSHPSGARFQR